MADATQGIPNGETALTLVRSWPRLRKAADAVEAYAADPESTEAQELVQTASAQIAELLRAVNEVTKALAELKAKAEFAVVGNIEFSPGLEEKFRIQTATSYKCDSSPDAMRRLMERYVASGRTPESFAAVCAPLTDKKAAELFGLARNEFMEQNGDLFDAHTTKPMVKLK